MAEGQSIDSDAFLLEQREGLLSGGSTYLRSGGKPMAQVQEELEAYFPLDQLEFKPSSFIKGGDYAGSANILTYLTARAIMRRLDAVVGPGNWQDRYERWGDHSVKCTLSIRCYCMGKHGITSNQEQGGTWVSKEDGSDETDIEGTKGGFSSALKRAAVKWGIGRYLYDFPDIMVWVKDGWSEEYNGKWRMKRKWKTDWSPPDSINRFLPGLEDLQARRSESPPAASQPKVTQDSGPGGKLQWAQGEPSWLGAKAPGNMKEHNWGELVEAHDGEGQLQQCPIGGGRWEWLYFQAFQAKKNHVNTRARCQVLLVYRVMGKWPVEEGILDITGIQKGIDKQVNGEE